MSNKFGNSFHHRHNRNGTHDSICSCCYMTVATATGESDVHPFEDAHICDPVRHYQVGESAQHGLSALNLDFEKPQVREMLH